mgnify:CR=1 FL=1
MSPKDREVPLAGKLAWPAAVLALGAAMLGLQPAGWARVAIVGLTLAWGIGGWLAYRFSNRRAKIGSAVVALAALVGSVVIVTLPFEIQAAAPSSPTDVCAPYVDHPELGTDGCILLRNARSKADRVRIADSSPSGTTDVILFYKNGLGVLQNDVTFHVELPNGISYVTGSSALAYSRYPSGVSISDRVVTTGVNIGAYSPNANAWVRFSVTAAPDKAWPCGKSSRAIGMDLTTDAGTRHDEAVITVTREC